MRKYLDVCIEVITAITMSVMIGTVVLQVFSRYVVGSPLGWTEEISSFALVWSSFLGSYLGFRRSVHLRIEIVYLLLPAAGKRMSLLVGNFVLIAVALLMIGKGVPYALQFMYIQSPVLQLPMGLSYAIVPLTGALFLVHLVPETYALCMHPETIIKSQLVSTAQTLAEAKIE
jgi:TRAP-type C4-dicarboxylate transport system permease small subunit